MFGEVVIAFVAACAMEYVLAYDSVLAIGLHCRARRIPADQQRLALLGAILFRVVFLACAARAAETWAIYVFGIVAIFAGTQALRPLRVPSLRGGASGILRLDAAYAVDSLAVLAVTRSAAILVASNVLATILQWRRLLAGDIEKRVPPLVTAVLLLAAGIELLVTG